VKSADEILLLLHRRRRHADGDIALPFERYLAFAEGGALCLCGSPLFHARVIDK
jgi:hypothetical protein